MPATKQVGHTPMTIHRLEYGPIVLRVLAPAGDQEAAIRRARELFGSFGGGSTLWEEGWEEIRVYPDPSYITEESYHEDEGTP